MAFLCPVRIRRNKKKKGAGGYVSEGEEKVVRAPGLGRITGSASIETLVRVGLEKEAGLSPDSKMVVLHDFTPCVDDELEVKRGSVVNVLYQENDWVYVIAEHGQQEGFIPHSYCAPYGSQLGELTMNHKKKMPRDHSSIEGGGGGVDTDHNTTIGTINSGGTDNPGLVGSDNESYGGKLIGGPPNRASDSSIQSGSATPDIHPFFKSATLMRDIHPFLKDPAGRYIVLYTFIARDENDVSVERGEFVTVLNREDPDWYWVLRSDGQEGFVPSGFVYPADVIQDHLEQGGGTTGGGGGGVMGGTLHAGLGTVGGHQVGYGASQHHINPGNSDDLRFHGSELVMLYDYKAQAPDDLSVRRGDWIYADLTNQTVDGWLWAYAPKTRKYGFIPKAYARPPAMTSL
ncbi:SH3 domain-containing protein Dlish isoform X1 [Penaeus vannamei]|uniref:SH3 domain-containing protein Dlish-like isoform X1 n=1 Tax=Penaeus japonicus TaxID=27405 RepID=UPI001C70EDD5|nr:SH3 domain-containing protein Dlish-like isoform X1 [Penaeus japonicus]XP_047470980.1 SH3 domain-containing protein Dlish-like isoform X1 [Penaeus chinensis]